jgi:hypothetical protein
MKTDWNVRKEVLNAREKAIYVSRKVKQKNRNKRKENGRRKKIGKEKRSRNEETDRKTPIQDYCAFNCHFPPIICIAVVTMLST